MSETAAAAEPKPKAVRIPKFEAWRRKRGLTQGDVAKMISCSHDLIWRAENGKPIRRKYIDRLVALGKGALKAKDFVEQQKRKGKENGTPSESRKRKQPAKRP